MTTWYMLTIVGEDNPGIVAKVTKALFNANCQLGEASMMRLGGNFTIMLMVNAEKSAEDIENLLTPICADLGLRFHLDPIVGKLHAHHIPDVMITVSGPDRTGIVADVTDALYQAGLDILDLDSDVAGTESKPLYIMTIEGIAREGQEKLEQSLGVLADKGIDVEIRTIDTLVG